MKLYNLTGRQRKCLVGNVMKCNVNVMKTLISTFKSWCWRIQSNLNRAMFRQKKKIQPLFYSKCFSLSYHSKSSAPCTPPAFSPPRTLSLSKYSREQASSMVRCSGCLFRWAAADETTVWSAVLSTDHPAGSCCHNDPQAGQETGNRKKKKAGHPVHLDQLVEHDITKASLFNEE